MLSVMDNLIMEIIVKFNSFVYKSMGLIVGLMTSSVFAAMTNGQGGMATTPNAQMQTPAQICAMSPLPPKCVAPCETFNKRKAARAAKKAQNQHATKPGTKPGQHVHGKLYNEIMNCVK